MNEAGRIARGRAGQQDGATRGGETAMPQGGGPAAQKVESTSGNDWTQSTTAGADQAATRRCFDGGS